MYKYIYLNIKKYVINVVHIKSSFQIYIQQGI